MKSTRFSLFFSLLLLCSCQPVSSTTSPSSSIPPSSSSSSSLQPPSSSSSSASSTQASGDGIVTLYSVNDFHGKVEQDDQYPGFLALQGSIKSDERYEKSSLFFSAGDMWQGSYVSGYDKGRTTTELMNAFPFSAMALGNHEFDWGVETIQENLAVADFPILCANLVEEETGQRPSWIQDHVTLEVEGHRLGVVGAIGANLESDIKASKLDGYSFTNSRSVLQASYQACVDEGAEMVLLLLHDDEDSGYTNFIQSSGIGFSAIFGGHSHQFQNETNPEMPYVQGGADSRGYSYLQLDFNARKVVDIGFETVNREYDSFADTAFQAEVEEAIESVPIETLGYIEGNWDTEATAQLVVQAMFSAACEVYPERNYSEENLIAAHNSGGIRSQFPDSSRPYPVTMKDIQLVSPFDNEVWVLPDKTIRASGMSYNYCYPDASTLDGTDADVVLIDFLLDMYNEPMYDSEGGEPILGEDGQPAVIYDIIGEYLSKHSSIDDPLRPSDL